MKINWLTTVVLIVAVVCATVLIALDKSVPVYIASIVTTLFLAFLKPLIEKKDGTVPPDANGVSDKANTEGGGP